MRISDWSSDVCSSDLLDRLVEAVRILAALEDVVHGFLRDALAPALAVAAGLEQACGVGFARIAGRDLAPLVKHPVGEGRALAEIDDGVHSNRVVDEGGGERRGGGGSRERVRASAERTR